MSKRLVMLALVGLMSSLATHQAAAANGAIGDRVSADLFCEAGTVPEGWRDAPKLVVLSPARSDYDGMLRLAFNAYFRSRLAFAEGPSPELRVIHVDGNDDASSRFDPVMYLGTACRPARGAEALAAIAEATGAPMPRADNADATVLLLDKDDVVRWRDDGYRAQGEHLKPLEAAVKSLLGRPDAVASASTESAPRIGEVAPDFPIALLPEAMSHRRRGDADPADARLSALRGKVVLITFYPAAFSGTLPTVDASPEETAIAAIARERQRMMSCALQIDELDALAPDAALKGDVVKIAISASTPELLSLWRRTLRTRDMHYVNDADYAIARRYGSFDAQAGYNLRKVFIVDREGKIAYIDEDYAPGDAPAIAAALASAKSSVASK